MSTISDDVTCLHLNVGERSLPSESSTNFTVDLTCRSRISIHKHPHLNNVFASEI